MARKKKLHRKLQTLGLTVELVVPPETITFNITFL